MEDKDIDSINTASHWNKIGNVYICDKCKHYIDEAKNKCPKCNCTMISVTEIKETK